MLALLLAAIVHDMGHDGFTNAFHKNRLTRRALSHNDQSIQVPLKTDPQPHPPSYTTAALCRVRPSTLLPSRVSINTVRYLRA